MSDFTIEILRAAADAAAIAKALGAPIDVNEALRVGRLHVLFEQDVERVVCLRHERRNRRRPIRGAVPFIEDAQLLGVKHMGKRALFLKFRQY